MADTLLIDTCNCCFFAIKLVSVFFGRVQASIQKIKLSELRIKKCKMKILMAFAPAVTISCILLFTFRKPMLDGFPNVFLLHIHSYSLIAYSLVRSSRSNTDTPCYLYPSPFTYLLLQTPTLKHYILKKKILITSFKSSLT